MTDHVPLHLMSSIHAGVWVQWRIIVLEVLWNLDVGPVGSAMFCVRVVMTAENDRLSQLAADLIPVLRHIIEDDILIEVLEVGEVLECPLYEQNASTA